MAKKKDSTKSDWQVLVNLIGELDGRARADEVKGGGDPADMEVIELEYKLAQEKLTSHILKMRREREE